MMKAAKDDRTEILRLLLVHGANLHAVNKKKRSALSFAAAPSAMRPSALGSLVVLLEAGAEVNQTDSCRFTPKTRAEQERRDDAVDKINHFEAKRR